MKTFFAFKNVGAEEPELAIYDEIGFWGVSAKFFHDQLKAIKAKKLTVRINSPGGSVVDGYSIYNMLRAHGAEITVRVDGIAASIASVIAMAGNRIVMPANALMLVHNPLVGVMGNAEELRKVASDLDKIAEGILNIYQARTRLDKATLTKLMDEETMMTAQEALSYGFATEVISEEKAAAVYKAEDYFIPTNAERVRTAFDGKLPSAIPAGGQEPQPDTTMKPEEIQAMQDRVAVLERDAATAKTATEAAVNTARQTATDKATADENARKSGIKAIADKYNKDGDLDGITITALAGATTSEAFKDEVLAAVAKRPTTKAIKTGEPIDGKELPFGTRYEACKTDEERQQLVHENRAEARRYLRSRK